MQPHPPPEPESFLEKEYLGIPLFIHIAATAVTCGLWLIVLLVVAPVESAKRQIMNPVDRVVDSLFEKALMAALTILAVPAYLLYTGGQWLYKRWKARRPKPEAHSSDGPPGPRG
ncbi:hypothetical protein KOI35_23235 [Actinoplanes bogorensis]|uniref:Uncharacterized protein n=1 Tax=Paractinoplanes bogorensis TaxID=1610840 RepID=A0ABS5YUP4_9ACTN|nr:hypothetical protein [Actinoplanes bogorensis]MBU2666423.1 hypothetical protein [Actinoplanes bogorensis]